MNTTYPVAPAFPGTVGQVIGTEGFHRWPLITPSSFFQVPRARHPEPDVQECRMLTTTTAADRSGLLPRATELRAHPASSIAAPPSSLGSALIIAALRLPRSLLLSVLPLLLAFSEAFFPVQPCHAQLL